MFLYVWMIGSALISQVKCNIDVELLRLGNKPLIVTQCSKFRMNSFMPAFIAADSPRRTRFSRLSTHIVILSFAIQLSNRMYRREIQHIKSHGSNTRQQLDDILKRSMFSLQRSRTRKQLVPTAE